jgi:hypothetical protein
MSAIGEALRTKLLSYNAVSTLVGQRMYPDALVQNAQLPAIVYYVTSTERDHALDGVTKSAHARVTFDCYATTRRVASSISKAIRETGIDVFRGTVEYLNDTPTDGNQEHRYLVSFDLLVHYGEP